MRTKTLTLSALCASLAGAALFAASYAPTMRLALVFIAACCTIPPAFEGNTLASYLAFFAAGILMLFLSPQKGTVLLYLCFGHYILFKIFAERRIFKKAWLLTAKALYFCFFAGACMALAFFLSMMSEKMLALLQMPQILLLVIGTPILWFILDKACETVLVFYHDRIRPYVFFDKNR